MKELLIKFFEWFYINIIIELFFFISVLILFLVFLFLLYLLELSGLFSFLFGTESSLLKLFWEDIIWYWLTGKWY